MKVVFPCLACLALLAGCKPEAPAPEDPCGAGAFQALVGEPVSRFDEAQAIGPVRILPPGSAMTMDHVPARLNLDLNDEDEIIGIWCG